MMTAAFTIVKSTRNIMSADAAMRVMSRLMTIVMIITPDATIAT